MTVVREGRAFLAYLRYRDYSGRGRRIKRSGRSRAEASREVLKAVKQAPGHRDRTARALSLEEVRRWLRVLDADPAAQHHDLPELARFLLATGLRLGEALVTWADLDLTAGTVAARRTIIRVRAKA